MTTYSGGRRKIYYTAAFLFLVAVVIYSPAIYNSFVYDDNFFILDNPWIRDFDYIGKAIFSNEWAFNGSASNYYRPTFHLFLMAEYHIFGTNPMGYHLLNLLLHAINTALLFFVAHALMAVVTKGSGRESRLHITAPLAALIFATHSVNSNVVNWVSAISDMLYTIFYLSAFYLYIKATVKESGFFRSPHCYLSIALFFLAMLSKETAGTFLIFIALFDFSLGSGFFNKRAMTRYVPYLFIIVLYLIMRQVALGSLLEVREVGTHTSLYVAIINVAPLVLAYMEKLIVPIHLSVVYTYEPVLSILDTLSIISSLFLILLAVVAVLLRNKRTVLFFYLWIFIPLITVLYYPAVSGAFSERYLYLSCAGFAMLVAYSAECLINSASITAKRLPAVRAAALIVVGLSLALYTYGSIKRSYVWRDDLSLWSDAVAKSPKNALAHNELGTAYLGLKETDKASYHYRQSIKLNRRYENPRNNLGNLLTMTGRYDEAMAQLKISLNINPNQSATYINIGINQAKQGLFREAELSYRKGIQIDPSDSYAYYNLALALSEQNKTAQATEAYEKAIELNPRDTQSMNNLANTIFARGDINTAQSLYMQAVGIKAANAEALNNLGIIMSIKGNNNESLSFYRRAIEAKANYGDAYYNMGITLSDLKRYDEAKRSYLEVIRLEPGYADAYNNLGALFMKEGDCVAGARYFRKAFKLAPDNKLYLKNALLAKQCT